MNTVWGQGRRVHMIAALDLKRAVAASGEEPRKLIALLVNAFSEDRSDASSGCR